MPCTFIRVQERRWYLACCRSRLVRRGRLISRNKNLRSLRTGGFVEHTYGTEVWEQALEKAGLCYPLEEPWVSSCPYHDKLIYR